MLRYFCVFTVFGRVQGSLRGRLTLCGFGLAGLMSGQGALAQAETASLASQLARFEPTAHVNAVAGVTAKSFSGVAWQAETQSLYVVDNDNASVYVLNTQGLLQRTITTTGITDPEGIVCMGGDDFLISEEGKANILHLKLPKQGNGPVAAAGSPLLNLGPDMGNSGIEGVGFRSSDRNAFAVKEISPPRLYRITLDASGNPKSSVANQPFNLETKSGDAADIFALNDGHFILVNQEGNRLEGYDSTGKLLSSLNLGMSKPEGLAIDTLTTTLYVVGEPAEFQALRMPSTALQRPPQRTEVRRQGATARMKHLVRIGMPAPFNHRMPPFDTQGRSLSH